MGLGWDFHRPSCSELRTMGRRRISEAVASVTMYCVAASGGWGFDLLISEGIVSRWFISGS